MDHSKKYAHPRGIPKGILCEYLIDIVDINLRIEILRPAPHTCNHAVVFDGWVNGKVSETQHLALRPT
jgi:hypothetical protein